jgi:hypothetical protein
MVSVRTIDPCPSTVEIPLAYPVPSESTISATISKRD